MRRLSMICMASAALLMLYASSFLSGKRVSALPQVKALPHMEVQLTRTSLPEPLPKDLQSQSQSQSRVQPQPQPRLQQQQQPQQQLESSTPKRAGGMKELDGTLETALKLAVAADQPRFLLVTFGNAGVKDHLLNFVEHVRKTGAAHLVGAVDQAMFDLLAAQGTPVYKTPLAHESYRMDGSNQHSSGSWKKFAGMRTGEVAKIVLAGFAVMHTDCDVIWLRDPTPYLMCPDSTPAEWGSDSRFPCRPLATADVSVSSDNMSPGRDTEGRAGYAAGGTFNTGLLFIRPNENGRRFVQEWHRLVVEPPRGSRFSALTSDQQAHTRLLLRSELQPAATSPTHSLASFQPPYSPYPVLWHASPAPAGAPAVCGGLSSRRVERLA